MTTVPPQPLFQLVCSLLVLLVSASAPAEQKECSWLGGSGAWSDPAKWDKGLAPDDSGALFVLVRIDNSLPAASDVYLDEAATIDLLNIDPPESAAGLIRR